MNPLVKLTTNSALRIMLTLAILCLANHICLAQAEWNRFRGPEGTGHVTGTIPLKWSENENISWKSAVPGSGHSSPVIADGKLWITTALTETLPEAERASRLAKIANPDGLDLVGKLIQKAIAYDIVSGRIVHDVKLFETNDPDPIHLTNTYASPTPVLHEGKLYAHFGTFGTACVDTKSGSVDWKFTDLKIDHQNGPGSSPIVWEDLLIVHFDGRNLQCVAALKLKDGSLAWRTDRSGKMHSNPDLQKAYCTPTVVQTEHGAELISPAANWVYGYDPRNGSELWKANYGDLGFSTVPCPIVGHGLAFICTSFMQSRLLAVRYGGRGDVTDSHVAWTYDGKVSQKPSLALVGENLYIVSDDGILTCLDSKSGKERWRHRLGGKYAASPLVSENLIYFFNQEGKTTVVRHGDSYNEVQVNELDGPINASPAVVAGAIYIRTDKYLYRVN